MRAWPLLAALVVLAGCGGGGGGGGGGDGTAGAQALGALYFPSAQNDTWSYDATSSAASGPFFDTIRVTGTRTVLGRSAAIFLEDNAQGSGVPFESYYFKDARGFTFLGNNDPADFLNVALAPYDEMLFGVAFDALTLFDKTGVSIGQDLDDDGIDETVDGRGVVSFDGFEPLVTTAGSFSLTAKVTATISITLRASRQGPLQSVTTLTQWRAPNVGLLKEITTSNVGGSILSDTLDVRGFRVGGAGAGYLAPRLLAAGLATASSDTSNPGRHAVGTDGTSFLLVGRQQTDIPNVTPTSKWTARIIAADGTAQAAFDLSLANANFSGEAAIAFDGANYMVLTGTAAGPQGASGIFGQRVAPAGILIDAAPGVTVDAAGINPAIAFGGSVYLVVYVKPLLGGVFGRIVLPSGDVGAEITIQPGTGRVVNPSVAFDGANFLVAWASSTNDAFPETSDILGARVTTAGTVLNSPISISLAPEAQDHPQVACDASNCLVIWTDRRNYPGVPYNVLPGPGDIFGTRISAGDALLDGLATTGGLAIATGITANAGFPGLAVDGTGYIAAWSRGAFVNNPGGPTGIYAARIDTSGTVNLGAASTGVPVSGPPAAAARLFFVAMAGGANGTLAAWLDNAETSGATKSVSGALMYPLASQ